MPAQDDMEDVVAWARCRLVMSPSSCTAFAEPASGPVRLSNATIAAVSERTSQAPRD